MLGRGLLTVLSLALLGCATLGGEPRTDTVDGATVTCAPSESGAAGRLHVSAVDPQGSLGEEWTRGDYPRSFDFDPSGRFLYSCNQRADHVAAFRVDPASGALECTGAYAAVGNPSSIVFLDLGTAR